MEGQAGMHPEATALPASAPRIAATARSGGPARWMKLLGGLLLTLFVTFVGLTAVTFVIGRLVPIDPVLAVVGDRATPEVYEKTRLALGLDRPIPEQYARYLRSLLTGDLGTSTMTSQPVLDDLLRVFPATFELATTGMLIGLAFGIPMGVAAAVQRDRLVDHMVRIVGLFGYSMPIFWLGLVGLLLFYAKLGWVSGPGRFDPGFEGAVPDRHGSAHGRQPAGWGMGRLRRCPVASPAAGCRARLCDPGHLVPHDARPHAARAVAGIYRDGPRQGPAGASHRLGACLRQHPSAR